MVEKGTEQTFSTRKLPGFGDSLHGNRYLDTLLLELK